MLKSLRIKFNKIAAFFQKVPMAMAQRAFLSFLLLFLLSLVLGGLIFYQYNILTKRKEANLTENSIQFNEEVYQDVLKIWQEREKALEGTGGKKYFDIFYQIK